MHGDGPFSSSEEPGHGTCDFPHVLGLPGHDTAGVAETTPPPERGRATGLPAGVPASEATYGFGATLPIPHAGGPAPAPTPVDPLAAPGATLGRYRLGGLLNRRAGTTVFGATHPVHGPCRVVVLDPDAVPSRGPRFLLETRLVQGVADPALLPILEVGGDPRPWYAQPQPPALTLKEALRRDGPWEAGRATQLLRALAAAMSRLHRLGVVHGDLDAEQVLLLPGGGVQLLGYGTPVFVGHLGDRQAYAGGPSLPPALHAPPEVQAGARPGTTADVWMLGLLLFQVRAGRPAFVGEDPREVQQRIAKGPPPRQEWPELPGALAAVLVRCLQKDPRGRYEDAGELLRAIDPPVEASAWSRRAAVGAAALALLGALAALGWWAAGG